MEYATLGDSCQTSMRVLSSANKYIPLRDPVYNDFWTHMSRYPGISDTYGGAVVSSLVQRPEEIKTKVYKIKSFEENNETGEEPPKVAVSSCCGRKFN
jgi:hypothetical protein